MRPAALLAPLLLAAAWPAAAGADIAFFQTPSGNIQCTIGQDFGIEAEVWCTILERGGPPATPALAGCGAGHEFRLAESGPVATLCDARTTADPSAPLAPYGVGAEWGRLSCHSSEAGFQCRNGDGHGFFLSRASQRVW